MRLLLVSCLGFIIACGSSSEGSGADADGDPMGNSGGSAGSGTVGNVGGSGNAGGGGGSVPGGSGGGSGGTHANEGGVGGSSGLPEDPNAVGVWINVTPAGDYGDYGLGHIVVDPQKPSDLYISGGARGTWKSSD